MHTYSIYMHTYINAQGTPAKLATEYIANFHTRNIHTYTYRHMQAHNLKLVKECITKLRIVTHSYTHTYTRTYTGTQAQGMHYKVKSSDTSYIYSHTHTNIYRYTSSSLPRSALRACQRQTLRWRLARKDSRCGSGSI
jgi:hypothetical protein